MYKTYILTYLILFLTNVLNSQTQNNNFSRKFYDELEHIKIDNIIFYENPYITEYNKPKEDNYKPDWYWAYCAVSYPLAFDSFRNEANKYNDLNTQKTDGVLKNYYKRFSELKPEVFGEEIYNNLYAAFYLTHIDTNRKYIMTLSYKSSKKYSDLSLKNIDTLKFKPEWDEKRIKQGKPKNKEDSFYSPLATHIRYYVLEDGLYKNADPVISEKMMKNNEKNLFFKGNRFDKLYKILRRAPKYTRSKIVDGIRIFERVKYTENGIIVIDKKSKTNNMTIFFIISLLTVILLILGFKKFIKN